MNKKRLMAFLLSGVLAMSNISTVFAEPAPGQDMRSDVTDTEDPLTDDPADAGDENSDSGDAGVTDDQIVDGVDADSAVNFAQTLTGEQVPAGKVNIQDPFIRKGIDVQPDENGYYSQEDLNNVDTLDIDGSNSGTDPVDLQELVYLPNLSNIYISDIDTELLNVDVLASLTKLHKLGLVKAGITDEKFAEIIGYVPNLEFIRIAGNGITSVECVLTLQHLKDFIVFEGNVTDIAPLIDQSFRVVIGGDLANDYRVTTEMAEHLFGYMEFDPAIILQGHEKYIKTASYMIGQNINVEQVIPQIINMADKEFGDPTLCEFNQDLNTVYGKKPGNTTMKMTIGSVEKELPICVQGIMDQLPENEKMDLNDIPEMQANNSFLAGGRIFAWDEEGCYDKKLGDHIQKYVAFNVYRGNSKEAPVGDAVITVDDKGQLSFLDDRTAPKREVRNYGVMKSGIVDLVHVGEWYTLALSEDGTVYFMKVTGTMGGDIQLEDADKIENASKISEDGRIFLKDGTTYYTDFHGIKESLNDYENGKEYRLTNGTLYNLTDNVIVAEQVDQLCCGGYLKNGKYITYDGDVIADHVVRAGRFNNRDMYYLDQEGNVFMFEPNSIKTPTLVCTSVYKVNNKMLYRENGSIGYIDNYVYYEAKNFKNIKYTDQKKNVKITIDSYVSSAPLVQDISADVKGKMEGLIPKKDKLLDGAEISFLNCGEKVEPGKEFTVNFPIPNAYKNSTVEVYRLKADNKLEKVNAVNKNGTCTFTTSKTGNYALVNKEVTQNGKWVVEGKNWKYRNADGSFVKNNWKKIDGYTYYFDQNGVMVKGWKSVGKTWYYFDGSGHMKTGWLKEGSYWFYLQSSGAMTKGWTAVNKTWYYFDGSGHMKTGWLKEGNYWFYLQSSGAMTKGWAAVNKTWYYFDGSGHMKTGWLKEGSYWFYLQSSGAMAKGWQAVGKTWYYFDGSGHMKTGWLNLDGKWYYTDPSGAMLKGWQNINGKKYYFNGSGIWIPDMK